MNLEENENTVRYQKEFFDYFLPIYSRDKLINNIADTYMRIGRDKLLKILNINVNNKTRKDYYKIKNIIISKLHEMTMEELENIDIPNVGINAPPGPPSLLSPYSMRMEPDELWDDALYGDRYTDTNLLERNFIIWCMQKIRDGDYNLIYWLAKKSNYLDNRLRLKYLVTEELLSNPLAIKKMKELRKQNRLGINHFLNEIIGEHNKRVNKKYKNLLRLTKSGPSHLKNIRGIQNITKHAGIKMKIAEFLNGKSPKKPFHGSSQFINIPGKGKRKVRYQKNGRAYVIVNKKKIKL